MMRAGKVSLLVRGLTFHPPGAEAPALDRFYSDVPAGRLLVVTGPAGGGKTVLLRLLATLLSPTAGTAEVDGADLRGDPVSVRERIGWLPSGALGSERDTARSRVVAELRLRGWGKGEAISRAEAVLGAVGLRSEGDVPFGALAPGARRRGLLARAVAHDPPVLLLDEPLECLDLVEREVAWAVLRAAKRAGRAIVCATRFPSGLEQVADAVAVLRDGRCLARGECADVRERTRAPSLEEAVLRVLAADGLPGAQDVLDARATPGPEAPPPASSPESPEAPSSSGSPL